MLNILINKYLRSTIISNLKGKKRWLVIIVLALALAAQSAGLDVGDLPADIANILETSDF